ncbi:non-heme iron oxygenase ferredoxin subunit [Pseudomonas aegrilactucae]|jgi:ethylbenzene dioxygenase ferredoxin subunit|uniref:Non-heme iron oxygenase ferredoxin subunit n=1 Tax=Pseudomonas aegrilactucae TaxID=2854028 RepID=A0A9Q2XEH3_9PSED|nr:non-heme iron oxygenase ferredoxin subunit [Pseudomonas aegrilactucae]MBV6285636.1 non-heme iron oxygenase ferredoxin subunit [Pseudomonas aegrilactucae]
MSRVLLCQRDELAPGELKKVAHSDGDAICVYNLGGTFYATTDMCTHATASLAEGDLEDDLITCPVHWGQFHVPSGKAVTFPCERHLRTYKVIVTDREVYADVALEADEALADADSPV